MKNSVKKEELLSNITLHSENDLYVFTINGKRVPVPKINGKLQLDLQSLESIPVYEARKYIKGIVIKINSILSKFYHEDYGEFLNESETNTNTNTSTEPEKRRPCL